MAEFGGGISVVVELNRWLSLAVANRRCLRRSWLAWVGFDRCFWVLKIGLGSWFLGSFGF